VGLGERALRWRLRRHDPEACREMIRRHHALVFGHLRRLGADASLAEDLTQETYAKAWRRLDTLRQAYSLRSWLLTIACNEYYQSVRSRKPEVTGLDSLPERADDRPPADSAALASERDRLLQEAVRRLDPLLQEIVALHYFQDLSLREVSELLAVPSGTVKSRLNRALDLLRVMLEQEALDYGQEATGETAAGHS
jgi:RNA polymerase sigma-70 factor (ECF subfamily)